MQSHFSINSIALGNIRGRRGQYALLIAAIVLAVYFAATALLFASTMSTSLRERHYQRMGEQDAILFDCKDAPLEELLISGVFFEYGTAEILGFVLPDGQNTTGGFAIAVFDDTALALTRKDPLEGRLPEKAGEIALERSALARLRTDAGVGDTITLTLLIPDGTGFLAAPFEKSYTLVGILTDKLVYLERRWGLAAPTYRSYPAGVLSADERVAPGGRAVVNCYGRYARNTDALYDRLAKFCEEKGVVNESGQANVVITRYRGVFQSDYNAPDSPIIATSVFFMVIAVVLVLAACLGIVNAFSASLESRKRQIGLLRAVGATKKQVRDIFGRETLLLSVFSILPGLALACLTVWGITAAMGPHYIFRPDALIIAAVALTGVLCVMTAAAIPLRKASRIPPMQAIRDVELSRKVRRSRVKSSQIFDVPRLIARRNLTLYKNKQVGITLMLIVSIVLMSLVAPVVTPLFDEVWDPGIDYQLGKFKMTIDWLMEYEFRHPGITEQDRADAAALSGVKAVTGEKLLSVKILTDKITPYIMGETRWRFEYLSPEPWEYDATRDDPEQRQWLALQHNEYLASKVKYGYAQDYLTVDCLGIDADVVEKLTPFVSAGRIDIGRLSSGEEILVIAPAEYGFIYEIKQVKDGWQMHYRTDYTLDKDTAYNAVYQNDMFQAGDTITISLLYSDGPLQHPGELKQYSEDGTCKLPDDVVRVDRTVTIGALLEPEAGGKRLGSYFFSFFWPHMGNIITTNAGLHALGFDLPYSSLAITLSGSPDAAMEEYLETNLSQIAARTAGVELRSHVAIARENRETAYGLLIAAGAVLLLFFAICASMVNNAISAHIRASRREIGTIRAVGASQWEIARSYLWQLISMFAWGTAIGMAAALALCGWIITRQPIGAPSLPVWQPLLFVAVLFGVCYLNIRSMVGGITRGSVVENIREL